MSNPFAPPLFPPPSPTSSPPLFPIPPQTQTPSLPPFPPPPPSPPSLPSLPSPPPSPPTTTHSVTVTETLPAESTVKPTETIASAGASDRNVNNTVNVAAMTFGIMISVIVVGGCITLLFTKRRFSRKKKPQKERSQRTTSYAEPKNVFSIEEGDDDNKRVTMGHINSISPPLNLPPPPPQRPPPQPSQRPLPQLPPSPPLVSYSSIGNRYSLESLPSPPLVSCKKSASVGSLPRSSPIVLYRRSSSIGYSSDPPVSPEYVPVYTDLNLYQNYSQLGDRISDSSSNYNKTVLPPQTHINEPP